MRRDLLEFEPKLACNQHDVGYVADYPFPLKLKKPCKVHQKPV